MKYEIESSFRIGIQEKVLEGYFKSYLRSWTMDPIFILGLHQFISQALSFLK